MRFGHELGYEMASIFEAESRGKNKDEDIVTSRVFGIYNIVNKSLILGKFLEKVGIKIPKEEVEDAQIRLWETHGECIPDAVIQTKSNLVFVELLMEEFSIRVPHKAIFWVKYVG